MIIGNFTYNKKADTYVGDIQLLSTQAFNVEFRPNKKSSDKEPDYRVVFERIKDRIVEVGAAWKRESEKGRAFVSVMIDDPVWAGPVNAALFLEDDGKTARLVWNRAKKAANQSTPAKKAA